MASYPTSEEIREMGFDLEAEIDGLTDWQRNPITLAELNPEVANDSPAMLHTWAYMAEAIFEISPTAKLAGYKVVRPLNREELEAAAMSAAKSREYSRRTEAEKEKADADKVE